MSLVRLSMAVMLGGYLAATPFLRYAGIGEGAAAHRNHASRHGGQLSMVGDHHLEVARRNGFVEVFLSDASRRPLRPAEGSIAFANGASVALAWNGYRLLGPDDARAAGMEVLVRLEDGGELRSSFEFSSSLVATN